MWEVLRFCTHYGLHFLFPGLVAFIFFRKQWKKAWLLLVLTMLVDLDHFLAADFFEANRCSIDFHPLHSYYAIAMYLVLFFVPKTRIVALGLLLHMATDYQDCMWM